MHGFAEMTHTRLVKVRMTRYSIFGGCARTVRTRLLAAVFALAPTSAFAALPAHIMDACSPQVSACIQSLGLELAPGTPIPVGDLYYQEIYACLQSSELSPDLFLYLPFEALVDALCDNRFPVRERAYNTLLNICSSQSACGSLLWFDAIAARTESLCPDAQRRVEHLARECAPVQIEIEEIPLTDR